MEVPSIKHILNNCLIFSVISTFVIAQVPQRYTSQNPCPSKGTCHECIQTPSCAWCFDPNYKESTRCFQPTDQSNAVCPEEFVLNPDTVLSIIENISLSETHAVGASGGGSSSSGSFSMSATGAGASGGASGAGGGAAGGGSGASAGGGMAARRRIVQVAPQRLSLKLRARQSTSIYMYYKQAVDYPVDLYYLMDLSRSMKDDKDKLSLLGDKLAETMKRLTSNFRLGFGSFVDKVVMPYVSTIPQNLRQPCEECAAPYGYKHAMRLSRNTELFSTEVKLANVSGNLDAPEGGFDAIMQSVVCREHIGWRDQARRLLVFSTDAGFHYAGDGKLGGIIKPNDGNCHMDEFGFYRESLYQDYPSIEQINLSVKKNSINVIFAVTRETIQIYQELSKNIEGSSVGRLEGDSSNIVDLIREQYEQISSTVQLKHNASNAVSLKFFTRGLNASGAWVNTNKCGGMKVGDTVKFRIDLEVIKCPKNRKEHFQTIQVYPVGINESLTIDLEMLCECDCEQPGHRLYAVNSPHCSDHGTYKCGVCECNPGAFGRKCECLTEDTARNITTMSCINPNTSLECSGKGHCACGVCDCEGRSNLNERIYGDYCECDNFSCERHDGELCSNHGYCDCGVCRCEKGWIGANCGCKNSTDACKPFGVEGEKLCSGNGKCDCGACVCDVTPEGRFSGKLCEKCPNCPDRCADFKKCVQCQQYQTGPYSPEECAKECTQFVPIPVEEVVANEEQGEFKCFVIEDNGCTFAYVYYYDEANKLQVKAQEKLKCPEAVKVPAIILGVIAAVVLIGMAVLLLWKLFTTIHDKREFARFEKEKMMAKWETGENPIYKQATSTFKNPTYSGKW